jgi:glycosyltransferase involved in cell wall biosynthesis
MNGIQSERDAMTGPLRSQHVLALTLASKHRLQSVNLVTKNIIQALKLGFGSRQTVNVRVAQRPTSSQIRAVRRWIDLHPQGNIVLIGESVYSPAIWKLLAMAGASRSFRISAFLMGDFIVRPAHFLAAEPFMKGLRVRWFVCSPRFERVLRRWIRGADVATCPFPVSTEKAKRPRTAKYSLIYAGRDYGRKNISLLRDCFSTYPADLPLAICGHTSTRRSKNIRELGLLSQKKLAAALLQSKGAVSLSTYFKEFFGYSIAQTLLLGKPVLITDWAGHDCFKGLKGVRFIRVHFSGMDVQLRRQEILSGFDDFLSQADPDPTEIAQKAAARFSIPVIAARYRRLLDAPVAPFSGFNSKLRKDAAFYSKSGFISRIAQQEIEKILSRRSGRKA